MNYFIYSLVNVGSSCDMDRANGCSKSNSSVPSQTMKVFQILKSTFCIRDTCPMSVVEKLKRRSYEELDSVINSTRDKDCINEKNIEEDSTVNTVTYDTSFENTECLCHISYTLDTWHQSRDRNDSCKVKIIPVQFKSTT